MSDEVEDYAIATREAYEQNPEEYFVYEKADDNDLCDTDGFLELGTHGCRWDFGLIISGKKRLEEIWGVHVVTTPNALAGSDLMQKLFKTGL